MKLRLLTASLVAVLSIVPVLATAGPADPPSVKAIKAQGVFDIELTQAAIDRASKGRLTTDGQTIDVNVDWIMISHNGHPARAFELRTSQYDVKETSVAVTMPQILDDRFKAQLVDDAAKKFVDQLLKKIRSSAQQSAHR